MQPTPPDRHLRAFATELHQLAYTMPNGHEYELLRLAGRMTLLADAMFTERMRGQHGEPTAPALQ